jgi:hypothetical protein
VGRNYALSTGLARRLEEGEPGAKTHLRRDQCSTEVHTVSRGFRLSWRRYVCGRCQVFPYCCGYFFLSFFSFWFF